MILLDACRSVEPSDLSWLIQGHGFSESTLLLLGLKKKKGRRLKVLETSMEQTTTAQLPDKRFPQALRVHMIPALHHMV